MIYPENKGYGCIICGSDNHTTGDTVWCNKAPKYPDVVRDETRTYWIVQAWNAVQGRFNVHGISSWPTLTDAVIAMDKTSLTYPNRRYRVIERVGHTVVTEKVWAET